MPHNRYLSAMQSGTPAVTARQQLAEKLDREAERVSNRASRPRGSGMQVARRAAAALAALCALRVPLMRIAASNAIHASRSLELDA